MVDFEISNKGAVVDPVILDSNPPFVFESAALTALRGWSYEPPRRDEPPRAVVVIRFEISDPTQD
jgi:TonB family protein